MTYAIKTQKLTKCFDDTMAVDNLDIVVEAGTTTALLGGNGAGKTTTISMLMGLMLPTSGSIEVLGSDIVKNRYAVLPSMNFSSPYVDLPGLLTVRQNLTVYGHLYGLPDLKGRIDELIELLLLQDLIDRQHTTLSAGQKTRATLAKALLNKPKLLLLDEPTASLDPDTADWMRSLLMDFQHTTGATIVMASHNMPEVERMCQSAIIMQKGKIVDQGAPYQLIKSYGRTTLEEVFLHISRDARNAD